MSSHTYLTESRTVTDKPLVLKSIVVTTDGGGPGKVIVYDGQGAEAGYEVGTLLCGGNLSIQFTWDDLELSRGLYVRFVEKADFVTVEWSPVGYPKPT